MRKALLVVSILAVVALGILNLTYRFWPEPDVVIPMANQHIDWHYAGK